MSNTHILSTLLVGALCLGTSLPAFAQINNKPYAFPNSSNGSVGMSQAGRQAILNQQIRNLTPENMARGPSGQLLDVIEGPHRSAFVSQTGTNAFIAGYKGTSYKGLNNDIGVGVFNSFFSPIASKSSGVNFVQYHSGSLVNTWTARVVSGDAPISYRPDNSVDNWTGGVYSRD
tara:strand:+ start:25302 stop:25823 length:522 start_codon:yes stop_codon:yes gene_type:complete